MERLRAERPVNERYPGSVERLRMLVDASRGDTLGQHIDDMLVPGCPLEQCRGRD